MLKDCTHKALDGTQICAECPRPDSWKLFAECRKHDPDLWFTGEDIPSQCLKAVRICMSCPVRGYCLEKGWQERFGIWGSFTALERERLRRVFPMHPDVKTRRRLIRTIAHRL